jgi:hypothetical protein
MKLILIFPFLFLFQITNSYSADFSDKNGDKWVNFFSGHRDSVTFYNPKSIENKNGVITVEILQNFKHYLDKKLYSNRAIYEIRCNEDKVMVNNNNLKFREFRTIKADMFSASDMNGRIIESSSEDRWSRATGFKFEIAEIVCKDALKPKLE